VKVARVVGWVAVGIVVLAALTVGSAFALGRQRLARAPDVVVRTIAVPTSDVALQRGAHLARFVVGCTGCHGADLAGSSFFDDPMMGSVPAPNLTSGIGGFGRDATVEDWLRAIRHGVGRDGRTLGAMPSNLYAHMSDDDLGAVLAYVRSVPPVDGASPARSLTPMGTIVFGAVGYATLPFSKIDHAAGAIPHPVQEVSADYGRYLTLIATCADCHGPDLRGYEGPPGPPPGPDISTTGALGSWSSADFMHLMRTGSRPDGRVLSLDMPWAGYAGMTDDELEAMYLYLTSLPGGG
jgi:mono/diheme cytochrome c family protein